jgi:hypothetical protein
MGIEKEKTIKKADETDGTAEADQAPEGKRKA